MNGAGINTEFARPLSNRKGLPLKAKRMHTRAIITLFFIRCPTAVIGAIIAVTVDTVNRMVIRWRLPHVCDKVIKGFTPAIAHLNTFFTIVPYGIFTSLNHASPNAINASEFTVDAVTMRPAVADEHFNAQASTTLRFTTAQLRGDGFRDVATDTLTPPFGYIPSVATGKTENGQAIKNAACNIFSASGGWIRKNFNVIFCVRHLIQSSILNYLARAVGCLRTLRPALIIAQ